MSIQENPVLDKIFSIIQELYIYCHLKIYQDYTEEEKLDDERIAMTMMLILNDDWPLYYKMSTS